MFNDSFDELYVVPQLPTEYTELRTQIDAILSDGAEYATPTSGTNIQSVQLTDLNGDGQVLVQLHTYFVDLADDSPNAGVANAATGEPGLALCRQTAEAASAALGIPASAVWVAGT